MSRIGLGEVSYDAAAHASVACDAKPDSIHPILMELLNVHNIEQVKDWMRQQRSAMVPDYLAEFATMMAQFHLHELVIESTEQVDYSDPIMCHFITSSCCALGLYDQAEKFFQLLPPVDDDGASFALLGAHVYRGLHDFEKALLYVQTALVKTAPGSEARNTLLFERAMLCQKLRHPDAVRQCIHELALKPGHADYLDAQLLLAKASELPNARPIYRHLLNLFPGNVRVLIADIKAAYELAVTKKELEDLLSACKQYSQVNSAEITFVQAGTCVRLAWFTTHPTAITLPPQPSLIPLSRVPTSAVATSSSVSRFNAAESSASLPSPMPAAISSAPIHTANNPSTPLKTAQPLGYKELLKAATLDFETCLGLDQDSSKLASKYRKIIALDLFSTTESFSAQLFLMARRYLDRAVSLDPRNVKAVCLLAEQLRIGGQVEEAQRWLSQLESTPTVLLGRALCLGMSPKVKDKESAISALGEIRGIAQLSALFHKGRLNEEIGQYLQAEIAYTTVLSKDPKHMETLYRRATLQLTRLHNPKAALVTLDTILHQYKSDTVILEQKAHALIILGQYQDAIDTLNEILRIDSNHTRALTLKTTAESLLSNSGYLSAIAMDSAQSVVQAAKSIWGYLRWN
jgi:tetratricopeptide (TPR) repeat protein